MYFFGFNSLQTGRHIQSLAMSFAAEAGLLEFQFPSNGKAYPKEEVTMAGIFLSIFVSIPFKREGISKGVLHIN